MLRRTAYLLVFLTLSVAVEAQINLFLGGNLQGNFSWLRGDEPTMEPGFGGGISFVYWEYEYWFLKTGVEFGHRTSSIMDYPDDYGITPVDQNDKIRISFREQTVGIPLTFFFRPVEKRASTLLISGSMNTMVIVGLRENSEEFGELKLKGTDMQTHVKLNLGLGIGYQHQLDKNIYLNILPSYNMDLRSERAFNSLTLTVELIFGIY